ncbi:MAG: heme ABC transporter permease [Pseudomonadota bacterium]
MWTFANPSVFLRWSGVMLPWLWGLTAAVFAFGLYKSFFVAPADYQQGNTVRIMFIHVPAAWLAMMCYAIMAVSALGSLVWRHPMADVSIRAAAPIGAVFTAIALITGALWGQPMWGTWWVWDARLTSVLVLFLMYLGLIALGSALEDHAKSGRLVAVLVLVGFINIPIIKFSVDWWNTLHQPASVARFDGPTIHPDILVPLLVMAVAHILLFFALHMTGMRTLVYRRKAETLMMRAAHAADRRTMASPAPEAAE